MRIPLIIAGLFFLSSCDNYITRSMEKTDTIGVVVQSFAASCCGICGETVVIDSLNGIQQALHIECDLEWGCCRSCTFGTEKLTYKYSGRFIVQRSFYKPIYDTLNLKRTFPKMSRAAYFDSVQLVNPILPLSSGDSLLISHAMTNARDAKCNKTYLSLIRGFVLVRTEDVKYKNPFKFKVSK